MPKPPLLRLDTADPRPIWRQIDDGVRRAIALRLLAPDASIPSVRELARELRVNPNTVARAFQSLSDAGVVEMRRGEGTFVAANPPSRPRREVAAELAEAAERFASTAVTLGATQDETLEAVEHALARLTAMKEKRR